MNMEIILKDGTKLYPSYAPDNRFEILKYYATMFERGQLISWKVL